MVREQVSNEGRTCGRRRRDPDSRARARVPAFGAVLLVCGLVVSAYAAARHIMVPGATPSEATTRAVEVLDAVGTNNPTITITPTVIDETTEEVTVTVDVPYADNAWILPWFTGSVTIHSSSTLQTERYRGV